MTPHLHIIEKPNKTWWVVDSRNILTPFAICNSTRTAVLVARCMTATGNYTSYY